jgi:8-oxo-dGTP diphosphatase
VAKLVHVAVGVIVNTDGRILIAKRPLNTHQGGLWEFPGGKVDNDETIERALVRELHEELAINVLASQPLIQIRHHYPDKSVLLDVHKITQFAGEPIGNEGQPIQWVEPAQLNKFEFPAANRPIISAINLPEKYAITGVYSDESDFILRLEQSMATGLRIVQLRVADFNEVDHQSLLNAALDILNRSGAALVINCSPATFSQVIKSHPNAEIGLHLNRHHAAAISERPVGQEILLGVSCHNADEIKHAQKIGADYLLLSPVLPTASHPSARTLGWEQFTALVELANIPVYALGGVGESHIKIAQSCGAQGVAGISAWW